MELGKANTVGRMEPLSRLPFKSYAEWQWPRWATWRATRLPSLRLEPLAHNNQTSGLRPSTQMPVQPTMRMWPPTYYVSIFPSLLHGTYVLCV
jgi:hypothetical protein